jgi:hypothetical protein
MRAKFLSLSLLGLTACLTHMPVKADKCHLGIHWVADYDTALARAQEEGKPVLAVLVAGKIDGFC